MTMTHWESSRRPLFLKTIWQDGQHHVILRKEENNNTALSPHSTFSSRKVKSAVMSVCQTKNLKVSSVKLLLSVSKNVEMDDDLTKPTKSLTKRCKTSVRHQRPPTWNNYLSARPQTNTDYNLSIESNTLDVGGIRPYTLEGTSSHLTYNHYMESYYNSLSEKVLVWLDLATQKGNYTKQLKIESQCISTESILNKITPKPLQKQRSLSSHQMDSNSNTFCVEGLSRSLQNSHTKPTQGLQEDTLASPDNTEEILLSSQIEENVLTETIAENNHKLRCKGTAVKRQLHIFMPNLPKRFADCDSSILSSKISDSSSSVCNTRSRTIQVVCK